MAEDIFEPKRLKDQVVRFRDGWTVIFNDHVQSPRWEERGPADIFLDQLQRGLRPEEVSHEQRRAVSEL